MFRKDHVLAILLFSGLWGLSEAALGGWLYAHARGFPASIVLAVVAFAILTVARVHVPVPGTSAAIGALAMLYKFFNEPFFACHLLAIFLLGAAYDVACSATRGRLRPLVGAGGTWLGFALFAVLMTYVFRYQWWAQPGLPKALRHVLVNGSIAAACNAAVVPLADWAGRKAAAWAAAQPRAPLWPARAAAVLTVCLWAFAAIQPALAA